jgi:hypothetical protein
MAVAPPQSSVYDEILDFLLSNPSSEQIIAMRPSNAMQERMTYLLDTNREGHLTPDERSELDEFMRIEHFVRMLKIRARERLTES